MSKGAINFSKDNEYYTPAAFVKNFGEFDYDPATTPQKALEMGIPFYDTKETDGLLREWGGASAHLDKPAVYAQA